MSDALQWLQKHHSDGLNITMKELLYYQGKSNLLDLNPRKTIQAKLAGSYLAKTKGRGMEFDEARHYQPGDDIRAIDWRVTARTGKTHTKLYREEKERPVFVLVDFSSSMYFGTQFLFKSVQAAHLASLIAWSAAKRGDRIGGLVFNNEQHREFKPLTRQKAVLSLLNGLVEMHQQKNDQPTSGYFAQACARLRRLARPGSLVFLISDFEDLDDAATQHISRIARHCEIVGFQITDPFEHQLPKVSVQQQVALTDGNNMQSFILGEEKTSQAYFLNNSQMFDRIATDLSRNNVQLRQISSAESLENQLMAQYRGERS